jgi:urocanate hydratase
MPAPASIDPELRAELEAVYAFYAALTRNLDPESGLGGKLLYAGELDQDGARLVRAANIAGAASLCAASDAPLQRSAVRDGVVDFLVTSLDEALRILKNEIRKRSGVSVAVTAVHAQLVCEMAERGVLPDLLRESAAAFVSEGAQLVEAAAVTENHSLFIFESPSAGCEHRALALIPESDHAARRWLRLAHRYLGPRARRIRSVPCDPSLARQLALL